VLKERLSRLKTLAERIVGIETTDKLFEERKNLLTSMAKASRRSRDRNEHRRRGRETQGYIDRIRVMLLAPGSDAPQDTLMHVKALMAEPRQAKSTR
jgi:hypothetical protein